MKKLLLLSIVFVLAIPALAEDLAPPRLLRVLPGDAGAFVIAMSGANFCFADNQGNSSSGFSGSLELPDRMQHRHNIIRKVWDLIDTLPYHTMVPRQELIDQGYCLADPGRAYLVYLETGGDVTIQFDDHPMTALWIQGSHTKEHFAWAAQHLVAVGERRSR